MKGKACGSRLVLRILGWKESMSEWVRELTSLSWIVVDVNERKQEGSEEWIIQNIKIFIVVVRGVLVLTESNKRGSYSREV